MPPLARSPLALAHLIGSIVQHEFGTLEIVVAGELPDLVDAVRSRFLPDAVVALGERTDSALWQDKPDGSVYVCRGGVCLAPVHDVSALDETLQVALQRVR